MIARSLGKSLLRRKIASVYTGWVEVTVALRKEFTTSGSALRAPSFVRRRGRIYQKASWKNLDVKYHSFRSTKAKCLKESCSLQLDSESIARWDMRVAVSVNPRVRWILLDDITFDLGHFVSLQFIFVWSHLVSFSSRCAFPFSVPRYLVMFVHLFPSFSFVYAGHAYTTNASPFGALIRLSLPSLSAQSHRLSENGDTSHFLKLSDVEETHFWRFFTRVTCRKSSHSRIRFRVTDERNGTTCQEMSLIATGHATLAIPREWERERETEKERDNLRSRPHSTRENIFPRRNGMYWPTVV